MTRQYGKSYMLLCERASELELRIQFAKKFNLSYKKEEQELNSIYRKLNGGRKEEKDV